MAEWGDEEKLFITDMKKEKNWLYFIRVNEEGYMEIWRRYMRKYKEDGIN